MRISARVLIVVVLLIPLLLVNVLSTATAGSLSSATSAALSWLSTHQLSGGSYGSCTEPQTAPAAYALWIAYRDSSNVMLSYNWLKNQMDNSTTYFWIGGGCSLAEADIPGEILYSFDASQNLRMLNLSFVGPKLLSFQQSNGGFYGYYDSSLNKQVTNSVDTSMALWGLIDAGAISAASETSAVNYLLSLQNSDGSFNLTKTIRSTSLYSLGPEPVSITALVVRVLKDAGLMASDSHISSALGFVSRAVSTNFNGHVYAASLAAIAFMAFNQTTSASAAVNFIMSQQNSDGGFGDIIRTSTVSNALDTGWAAVALQVSQISGSVGGSVVQVDKLALLVLFITPAAVVGSISATLLYTNHKRRTCRAHQTS